MNRRRRGKNYFIGLLRVKWEGVCKGLLALLGSLLYGEYIVSRDLYYYEMSFFFVYGWVYGNVSL